MSKTLAYQLLLSCTLILTLTCPAEVVFQAGEFETVRLQSLPAWPVSSERAARTGLGPEWTGEGPRLSPSAHWNRPAELPPAGLLILVSTPPPDVVAGLAAPLRQYLERGGSLLVTHQATRAIAALGLDARANDEEAFSYSARDYAWGFSVPAQARDHPLFAGLVPVDASHSHSFFIARTAQPQTVVFSRYAATRPASGRMLASYFRRERRDFADFDQCAILEWEIGQGRVVALGIPLFPAAGFDASTEPNRRRLIENLLAYLNPGQGPVRLLAPDREAFVLPAPCDELAPLRGGKIELAIPEGARRFDAIPALLDNDGAGAWGFSGALTLAPGVYRMTVGYLETGASRIVFMRVNERDIGLFFVPPHEAGTPFVTRKAVADFVIERAGRHRFGLELQEGAGVVALDALSIEKIPMPAPRDWSADETAVRPPIDAWGWYAPISYQRPTDMGVDLAYMQRRVIAESYMRGSNMVELFHDYFFPFSSWHMPWDESDPGRPASYRYVENPHWGAREFIEMARLSHRHDMLFHWYHFNGGTQTREDKLALLAKAADDYGDALDMPAADLMDGMGLEAFVVLPFEDVGDAILPYNPGYYLYDLNRSTTEALSFFSPSTMCAHAWEPEGYDDAYPIVYPSGDGRQYYWRRYLLPENGQQRLGYQADCRIRRPPAGPFKDTWFFGGGCHPDWVVKQCFDFLRDTHLDPATGLGSAVWWITEVEEITDDPMRRIVYAASMDPIRAALAFDLGTTGVGGFFDQVAGQNPGISNRRETIWRPRLDRPYTDHALQNNYFRLYIPADGSPEALDFDPTGTAHFDFNSMAVRISEGLISGKASSGTSEVGIVETGGVVASILASRSDGPRLRYETVADSPILRIDDLSDPRTWADLLLGLSAYERREARGSDGTAMTLTDEDGVLPTLLVRARDGRLREKDGTLTFEHFSIRGYPIPAVTLGLLVPPYRTLDELEKAMDSFARTETRQRRGTTFLAGGPIPRVAAVELTSMLDRPRWVRERGWWWYRGIQPSQSQEGKAWVKVYSTSGDEVEVRPYGFLPEGVKFAWGSQYVLTFRDVKRVGESASLTARVLRTTPWVFAPRLEFENPIASVTLDGKPWFYFDGPYLMLPNVMGTYLVEVKLGEAKTPAIGRTQGVPREFTWENDTLRFTMGPAGHIKTPASDETYYALVRHPGKSITAVSGAEVKRTGKGASVLSGRPGRWVVGFGS